MGKRKPFDRKLYNEVNDLSIKAVKKYLTDSGHTITSTKENLLLILKALTRERSI